MRTDELKSLRDELEAIIDQIKEANDGDLSPVESVLADELDYNLSQSLDSLDQLIQRMDSSDETEFFDEDGVGEEW